MSRINEKMGLKAQTRRASRDACALDRLECAVSEMRLFTCHRKRDPRETSADVRRLRRELGARDVGVKRFVPVLLAIAVFGLGVLYSLRVVSRWMGFQ
jgi:hypothetical protein